MITKEDAQEIIGAHEIESAMEGEEGTLLEEHNPRLFNAYKTLLEMASDTAQEVPPAEGSPEEGSPPSE